MQFSGIFLQDLDFRFSSNERAFVYNVMAGNLSVRRDRAIAMGGFDERFIGAAYRFETDFARRLIGAGGMIRFEPAASIRHLKLETGGLRSFGDHRKSASPVHAVGDYYFCLLHANEDERGRYIRRRLRQNILTRSHLAHPWWIPPKIVGEMRGLLEARRLVREGRLLIKAESQER